MASERRFRPDIEGLRGIAILLVVGFHAGVRALEGAFVGVDVFFVLSGYFITRMLAEELSATGRVDLSAFYARRAQRLLPALLLVLLATLALVMWLYAPIDRPAVVDAGRAVALYSGNIEFARTSVDYFSSTQNPLLHTWSLAVEEQFYLVWPLLFVIVALLYRRDDVVSAHRLDEDEIVEDTRKRLLVFVAMAGVVSFGVSIWLSQAAPAWAFFGMPTRIWEFAVGGLLALILTERTDAATWPATLLSVVGLVAIALAVATYHRGMIYPGAAALLPALGAAAVIVGGSRAPDSWPSRALGVSWLRGLGRLSYAWYLWHWPLMGLGAALNPRIGVGGRLAWAAGALALAWLTHRYVEGPARTLGGGRRDGPPRWVLYGALAASLVGWLASYAALRVARAQVSQAPQRAFAAARVDHMQHSCWGTTADAWSGPCEFGDRNATTTLALLGDSHAEHWLAALDRAGRERGWKIVAMVKGGCPVAEVEVRRRRRLYAECTRFRAAMLERIEAMRPDAVILSSWDHYVPPSGEGLGDWHVSAADWQAGLRRTYARLTGAGLRVVAMRGTPRTWFDVPQCLSRRAAGLPGAVSCDYARRASLHPVARRAQDAAARGLPVSFVDMNDQVCRTERCRVTQQGTVLFTDDNHLTASFSRSLAPVLGTRLQSALALSPRTTEVVAHVSAIPIRAGSH